jgi:hypothetical protein
VLWINFTVSIAYNTCDDVNMWSCAPLAALAIIGQLTGVIAKPAIAFDETAQKPLSHATASPKYTLYEQSEEICNAGSRQWTGWINVSDEKKLFFCKLSPPVVLDI